MKFKIWEEGNIRFSGFVRLAFLLLLLLSLNAHNHGDDYSGTLGGVRKVHISALVTSPKN